MGVSISISSTPTSYQGGVFSIGPFLIASSYTSVQVSQLSFASSGTQSVNGPTGAFGALIEPPVSNTTSWQLGTGPPLAPALPNLVFFNNPSTSNTISITAGAAMTAPMTITFF